MCCAGRLYSCYYIFPDPSTTSFGNCTTGDFRLVGNESLENGTREGRVELCINDAWGTVCNRLFDPVDAETACQQLGGFYRQSKWLCNCTICCVLMSLCVKNALNVHSSVY